MIADTECNAQYSQELVCSRHTAFTPTLHGTGCYVMPQDAQLPSAFFGVHLAQLRAIRTLASHHTISRHITSHHSGAYELFSVAAAAEGRIGDVNVM